MLDAHVRRAFLEVLGEFREQYQMTTLFITHDLSTVAYLGGEMMTMYQGDIVEQGPVEKLLSDPEHSYTKLLVASVPVAGPRQALAGPGRAGQRQANAGRRPECRARGRKWRRQDCPRRKSFPRRRRRLPKADSAPDVPAVRSPD